MSNLDSQVKIERHALPNRALRIHGYGGAEVLQLDAVPIPVAGDGEVLVKVHAAGINGLDWKIRAGYVRDAFPLPLPAILGLEFSGEVVAVGAGVRGFDKGTRVMAALGGLGAYAEYIVVAANKLVPTPSALDDITAAATPVSALTAWQALFEAGALKRGERVLIHGGAGGVGSFAIQFAHAAGAHVITTARNANAGLLRGLGANEVIDYQSTSFWEQTENIDLVLDLIGGNTLKQSWNLLSHHGRIVSTAAPEIMATTPEGKKGSWFTMRPDTKQLSEFAAQVAQGSLHVVLDETATLTQAGAAIERNMTGHGAGKSVIRFDN